MIRNASIGFLIAGVCVLCGGVSAQTTRPAGAPRAGQCHALIVSGLGGSPLYARRYRDWAKRFGDHLTSKAKVPAANVTILTSDKDLKSPLVRGPATRKAVLKSLAAMAGTVQPKDQFVLILIGHGSASDKEPTLALPGRDLTPKPLADALLDIQAANQVVLNFSGAAGGFLKDLSCAGRVNISATLPEETAEPVFAEFFLRALESARADGEGAATRPPAGAKDGKITLLEAYHWATRQTAMWISRQTINEDDTWTVTGKESVKIFKKLYEGPAEESGTRKLSSDSDATIDDPDVAVVPPQEPEEARLWDGRRVVNEHAALDDLGGKSPLTALRGESGYEPIAPVSPRKVGYLAAGVVLGTAAVDKPGEK